MNEGKDPSQFSVHAERALLQIDFYHLRNADLATPLAMLAYKTVASGHKLLILAHEDSHVAISERLWTFRPDSFLAHAADENEGHEHAQIWLTSDVAVNQIDARFLALQRGLNHLRLKHSIECLTCLMAQVRCQFLLHATAGNAGLERKM